MRRWTLDAVVRVGLPLRQPQRREQTGKVVEIPISDNLSGLVVEQGRLAAD